jgi:acetyl-CoA synthetase
MIAVGGQDCVFCAIVLPAETTAAEEFAETVHGAKQTARLISDNFVETVENEEGALQSIAFKNDDKFNFSFDIVDKLAADKPDMLAMVHLDNHKNVRKFTFSDMSRQSSRTANYFKSLGIKRRPGDAGTQKALSVLVSILALHKLGAVVIPATNQLLEHDFEYRFNAAGVSAIVCTADGDTAYEAEKALPRCPSVKTKILVGEKREGWHDFNEEYAMFRSTFLRPEGEDEACGEDRP